MKCLLDTHTLIWAVHNTNKISTAAFEIIQDTENSIYVSAISFWEISLKFSIGKIGFETIVPESVYEACILSGFILLPLDCETANSIHHLGFKKHKDPFDRMLIWSALKNDFNFITKDKAMKQYQSLGLKTLW
jgi:PIN domain nuclease of toxin-antitoxin system